MKKLFLLVVVLGTLAFTSEHVNPCKAQIVKSVSAVNWAGTAKTSVSGVDTAFFNVAPQNSTVSYQALATRTAGTLSGDIILQGSNDNSNWDNITTFNFVDQVTNYKVFSPQNSVGKLQYAYYRMRVRTATGTITISGNEVRRN
jgi:uncharacterized membrane protein